ncbi:MAG: MATE family efflux transporter [Pseudomonadota bacterium]
MSHPKTIKAEAKSLLILGLPLIGSQVAQFAVHTTDVLMLGRYSIDALAQSTLGAQIYFVAFVLGSGFAFAILPMVAKAADEKDWQSVRRSTRMGLWTSTLAFVVLMIPMWFSEPLLLAIKQKPDVAAGAQVYLRIAGWGLLPFLWASVLRSYLSALEHTAVVFWLAVVTLMANVAANYLLIYGNLGAPELGLRGAAIASLTVSVLSFVGFAMYTVRVFPEHDLFRRFWRADWQAIWKVTLLALPISGTALAESGLFAAATFMMGAIGKVEIAAGGIVIQPAALAFMFHLGLSQAATIHAGYAFSRQDRAALHRTAIASGIVSTGFAILVVILFITAPSEIVELFVDDDDPITPAVIALGVTLMFTAAAFQFVDAAQVLGLGVLRGLQDTAVPMVLAVVSYWGVGAPVAYALGLPLGYGAVGVWVGLVAGLTAAAILLWWRYAYMQARVGQVIPPPQPPP